MIPLIFHGLSGIKVIASKNFQNVYKSLYAEALQLRHKCLYATAQLRGCLAVTRMPVTSKVQHTYCQSITNLSSCTV